MQASIQVTTMTMCAPDTQKLSATELSTTLIAMIAVPILAAAAEPEVLDEDFLEYLAEFDNEEDDWSWFDAEDKAAVLKKAASQKDKKVSAESTEKAP